MTKLALGQLPSNADPSRFEILLTGNGWIAANTLPFAQPQAFAPTAGLVYGGLVGLYAGDVVTNVGAYVNTAGTSTAPTLLKMGLYDKTGLSLRLTGDVTSDAQWTGVGFASFNLTSTYTVATTDVYYVVFLQVGAWGGTAMQLGTDNNLTSPAAGRGAVNSGKPFAATFGGSQTDLKAVGQSATPSAVGRVPWLGVG